MTNTITGSPVNLAITPDRHLALVANSLDWVKDGDGWKGTPDNKIYVIDLTALPPTQIGTVEAGKQASGMTIPEDACNRANLGSATRSALVTDLSPVDRTDCKLTIIWDHPPLDLSRVKCGRPRRNFAV